MLRFLASIALAGALVLSFQTSPARASTFDVSPITLTLSAKVTSGILVVTNRGSEAVRFQVSAFSWGQRPDGEMILNPTKDVVFFPAMMTLNPGEARKLRVGTNVKPDAIEKTYRVFVQELPPLVKTESDEGTIRVLTKMGIPIFIEPASPKPAPAVTNLELKGRKLSFELKNAGNVHYRPEKISVAFKDATKVFHTEEIPGWYVLAGGSRTYTLDLPEDACKALKSLQVDVATEKISARGALASAKCGP